ncbi:putative membrane protein [Microbacterium sp. AK009]|nr:putative membrane protein [Microbacterium sp. AK009]
MTTATLPATAPSPSALTVALPTSPVSLPRVHRFGTVAISSLPIGVLLAILTTTDPDWWHLHFSQLGTFGTVSSKLFNSTVLFSGFFLAAYGVLLSVALPHGVGRRTRRIFRGSVVSAGLHLTVVGMIPIPVSVVLHDLAASGLGLSFLTMVASSLGIRGRHRAFRRFTILCVVILASGMVILTAGFITLALFEIVAFSLMLVWLGVLPRALAYRAPVSAHHDVTTTTARTDAAAARRTAIAAPGSTPAGTAVTARRHGRPALVSAGRPPRRRLPRRVTRRQAMRLPAFPLLTTAPLRRPQQPARLRPVPARQRQLSRRRPTHP